MLAKRAERLKRLNIGAGVLHMVNFVTALMLIILYHPQSFQGVLSVDFGVTWKRLGQYPLVWVDLARSPPLVTVVTSL